MPTGAAGEAGERCWNGVEYVYALRQRFCQRCRTLGEIPPGVGIDRLHPEQHLIGEGREMMLAPYLQLCFGKGGEIVALQACEQRVSRERRLHQHFARQAGPPGAPSHLHQLGEEFFLGAEVRGIERRIGIDHGYQRELGKVMALGEHLRAHEDVHVVAVHTVDESPQRRLARHRITVHTQNARIGKFSCEPRFDALRPLAHAAQIGVAAARARRGRGRREAAVMAAQPVSRSAPGRVKRQPGAAARAIGCPAALPAE